jgi:hypothetical protein
VYLKKYAHILILSSATLAAVPAWAESAAGAKDLFSGAWRMVSLEAGEAGGVRQPLAYSGQIVFTNAGTMSVQAMNPDPKAAATPYTINGYEATYGRFVIDEEKKTFVFSVESSLVRNLIGQDLKRTFEISQDRLVLTPTNPQENWRVVYERF